MGRSHSYTTRLNGNPKTLLDGQDDEATSKMLGQWRGSLPKDIDSVPIQEAITLSGFVPTPAPGVSIGSGSDARSVMLHSAILGGAWITNGAQDAIVVEQLEGRKPTAASKRWLVVVRDDSYLKLVELNVTSCDGQLYVQAVSGKHQWPPRNSGRDVELGIEANLMLGTMSAAPVVTSLTALGYGVLELSYSLDTYLL